jgi:hypothetical protein
LDFNPTARSAGTHVPQATQRTNLPSAFAELLTPALPVGCELVIVLIVPRIFPRIFRYGCIREYTSSSRRASSEEMTRYFTIYFTRVFSRCRVTINGYFLSSPDLYETSTLLRRGAGSLDRRRGVDSRLRRSTLPAGRPLPWTASSRMRVISCERVLCSAAARLRKDSFRWLGTYAPMNTPLRFAISRSLSFRRLVD